MRKLIITATAIAALAIPTAAMAAAPDASAQPHGTNAVSAMPPFYKNCSNLNAKYPHGVGKAKAVDRSESGDPVTTFKRSTALYNKAMSYNRGLDRDKDGVACEKA